MNIILVFLIFLVLAGIGVVAFFILNKKTKVVSGIGFKQGDEVDYKNKRSRVKHVSKLSDGYSDLTLEDGRVAPHVIYKESRASNLRLLKGITALGDSNKVWKIVIDEDTKLAQDMDIENARMKGDFKTTEEEVDKRIDAVQNLHKATVNVYQGGRKHDDK